LCRKKDQASYATSISIEIPRNKRDSKGRDFKGASMGRAKGCEP